MGLSAVMTALVEIELGRSFLPFTFAGSADNILYDANEAQQDAYLRPTISGERKSCFAITEPGAGSDARAIRTSARRDGDEWVINGEKTFITGGNEADYVMVFAVTDKEKGADGGVTCFLVDRDRGGPPRRSTRWASGDRRRWCSRTFASRTTTSSARRARASRWP